MKKKITKKKVTSKTAKSRSKVTKKKVTKTSKVKSKPKKTVKKASEALSLNTLELYVSVSARLLIVHVFFKDMLLWGKNYAAFRILKSVPIAIGRKF